MTQDAAISESRNLLVLTDTKFYVYVAILSQEMAWSTANPQLSQYWLKFDNLKTWIKLSMICLVNICLINMYLINTYRINEYINDSFKL